MNPRNYKLNYSFFHIKVESRFFKTKALYTLFSVKKNFVLKSTNFSGDESYHLKLKIDFI